MKIKSYKVEDLEEKQRELLGAEILSNEKIEWIGKPNAINNFFKSLPILIFAIPWTLFSIFWTVTAAGFKLPNSFSWELLFPCWGIPFIAVGLLMLYSPYYAYLIAKKTFYVVTNNRVILFEGYKTLTIKSIPIKEFSNIFRREKPNGRGDLVLKENYLKDSDGDQVLREIALKDIESVKDVETMLKNLAKQ